MSDISNDEELNLQFLSNQRGKVEVTQSLQVLHRNNESEIGPDLLAQIVNKLQKSDSLLKFEQKTVKINILLSKKLNSQLETLIEDIKNKEEIIQEYKKKNNQLLNGVKQLKQFQFEVEELKGKNSRLKEEKKKLQDEKEALKKAQKNRLDTLTDFNKSISRKNSVLKTINKDQISEEIAQLKKDLKAQKIKTAKAEKYTEKLEKNITILKDLNKNFKERLKQQSLDDQMENYQGFNRLEEKQIDHNDEFEREFANRTKIEKRHFHEIDQAYCYTRKSSKPKLSLKRFNFYFVKYRFFYGLREMGEFSILTNNHKENKPIVCRCKEGNNKMKILVKKMFNGYNKKLRELSKFELRIEGFAKKFVSEFVRLYLQTLKYTYYLESELLTERAGIDSEVNLSIR